MKVTYSIAGLDEPVTISKQISPDDRLVLNIDSEDETKGLTCTLTTTIKSLSTEKAVQFDLGTNADDTYILLPVRVPAGESVSRTVEITDFDALDNCPVYISVSCPDDIGRTLDLEISAVQIKK